MSEIPPPEWWNCPGGCLYGAAACPNGDPCFGCDDCTDGIVDCPVCDGTGHVEAGMIVRAKFITKVRSEPKRCCGARFRTTPGELYTVQKTAVRDGRVWHRLAGWGWVLQEWNGVENFTEVKP